MQHHTLRSGRASTVCAIGIVRCSLPLCLLSHEGRVCVTFAAVRRHTSRKIVYIPHPNLKMAESAQTILIVFKTVLGGAYYKWLRARLKTIGITC